MAKQLPTYLTESSLGDFLKTALPNGEWIHDKAFITKTRPDYRNDKLKLIVEFDGYLHYTSAKRIVADFAKDELYEKNGYSVIRIPYFVQLSNAVIKHLFKIDINIEQVYPHGFIDKTCILPADFCELGIVKFKDNLRSFNYLLEDIIVSLQQKIEVFQDKRCVIPQSLESILKI